MPTITNQKIQSHAESKTEITNFPPVSLQQPVWHVAALCVLTCFAYCFYWFYKTWRDLAACGESQPETAKYARISPLLRTIGLFVPVLHVVFAFNLFSGIANLYPKRTSAVSQHPKWSAAVLVMAMVGFIYMTKLPGAWYFLSLGACIPLAIAQSWLNAYWQSLETKDEQYLIRQAFTGKELLAIILGSLLLGLIAASFFL